MSVILAYAPPTAAATAKMRIKKLTALVQLEITCHRSFRKSRLGKNALMEQHSTAPTRELRGLDGTIIPGAQQQAYRT